jgi:chromosomal replication initiation ATPase DnaA
MSALQLRLHEEHKERQGRIAESARQALIRQRRIENAHLATQAIVTAGGRHAFYAIEDKLKKVEREWAGRHEIRPRSTKREEILYQVIEETGFTQEQLFGLSKVTETVRARHYLFWRLYRETTMSLGGVGKYVNRDHTVVLHGIRMHEKRMNGWTIKSGKPSVPPGEPFKRSGEPR